MPQQAKQWCPPTPQGGEQQYVTKSLPQQTQYIPSSPIKEFKQSGFPGGMVMGNIEAERLVSIQFEAFSFSHLETLLAGSLLNTLFLDYYFWSNSFSQQITQYSLGEDLGLLHQYACGTEETCLEIMKHLLQDF